VTILKLYIYSSDETPHLLEVQLGLQATKLKANIRDKAKGWLWSQWKPIFYTHAHAHTHILKLKVHEDTCFKHFWAFFLI
jgi:hypothetical protein